MDMKKDGKQDRGKKQCERCVICRRETDVPADLEIGLRRFYIEGAGQLCPACYRELYR